MTLHALRNRRSDRSRAVTTVAAVLVVLVGSHPSAAAPSKPPAPRPQLPEPPQEPRIHPTPLWAAMQLLPSPALEIRGDRSTRFGLQWQVTPVLYGFNLRRGLSPWRFLVAEPHVRQGGSIEAYLAPELYFGPSVSPTLRPGIRAYFPVLSRGEYLSLSVGTSYQSIDGVDGAAFEAGAYILFGILGLHVSHVPGPSASTVATIRLRYF